MHNDLKLYLVFEYLDLDLKKYMDAQGSSGLSPDLVKVTIYFSKIFISRAICINL